MEQSKRSTEEVLEGIYSKSGYLQELWNNLPREGKDLVIDSKNTFEKYLSQRLGEDVEYHTSHFNNCMIEAFAEMMEELYPDLEFVRVQYLIKAGWNIHFRRKGFKGSEYMKLPFAEVLSKKLFNQYLLMIALSDFDLIHLTFEECSCGKE